MSRPSKSMIGVTKYPESEEDGSVEFLLPWPSFPVAEASSVPLFFCGFRYIIMKSRLRAHQQQQHKQNTPTCKNCIRQLDNLPKRRWGTQHGWGTLGVSCGHARGLRFCHAQSPRKAEYLGLGWGMICKAESIFLGPSCPLTQCPNNALYFCSILVCSNRACSLASTGPQPYLNNFTTMLQLCSYYNHATTMPCAPTMP